jgi:DNA-binding XRE family transcriptional regulator
MLGDLLKRDRERWGMTQGQAARRFGLSLPTYRKVESGAEKLFDFDAYSAIAELFGWPRTFCRSPRSRVSLASDKIGPLLARFSVPGRPAVQTCWSGGGPPGTRTPNLRIKSPLLCQLS